MCFFLNVNSIYEFDKSKIVSLDISKLFGRVWNDALRSKVTAFGVGNVFNRFIDSLLSDRTIGVV